MLNENKAKGNALEKTVKLIQESILKDDPKFAGIKFTVEQNETLIIAGVRHEVDVLVKTCPGSQYESVWIFECKNWNKPVGKNEIIILAEKVKVVGATRGFLVAREFTADAEAQAKLDNRLELIPCADDFLTNFSVEMCSVVHDPEPIRISVKHRGVPPLKNPNQLDWKQISCEWNGRPTDLRKFIMPYADKELRADQNENQVRYNRESSHYRNRSLLIQFERNEFLIDGKDIEYLTVDIPFWVKVKKLKLVSKFELKHQGRVFSFESIDDEDFGNKIQIDLVQRI